MIAIFGVQITNCSMRSYVVWVLSYVGNVVKYGLNETTGTSHLPTNNQFAINPQMSHDFRLYNLTFVLRLEDFNIYAIANYY